MIEVRIEQEMNKMVSEGKFPKFIYLNLETMKELAFEITGERVMDMKEEEELSLDSFRVYPLLDHSMCTAYFRVDSILTNGEIRITEEEIQ